MKLVSNVEAQLRKLIVYHRNLVKQLLISDRDATIVQYAIKRKRIKTSDIVELFGTSTQSASKSLRDLKLKGYLVAEETPDPTGGYYLEYKPSDLII